MIDLTIPRLELMSCVLLTILQSAIHELIFNFKNICCWSYSIVAVHWIKNVSYGNFGSKTLQIFEKDLLEKCIYESSKFG